MIFSLEHIELIKKEIKLQTRRRSGRYQIGINYAVQPCRTCKSIGRILILKKKHEICCELISVKDALEEGNYTPSQYEDLYEKLNPKWQDRYAYTFRILPKTFKEGKQ